MLRSPKNPSTQNWSKMPTADIFQDSVDHPLWSPSLSGLCTILRLDSRRPTFCRSTAHPLAATKWSFCHRKEGARTPLLFTTPFELLQTLVGAQQPLAVPLLYGLLNGDGLSLLPRGEVLQTPGPSSRYVTLLRTQSSLLLLSLLVCVLSVQYLGWLNSLEFQQTPPCTG